MTMQRHCKPSTVCVIDLRLRHFAFYGGMSARVCHNLNIKPRDKIGQFHGKLRYFPSKLAQPSRP